MPPRRPTFLRELDSTSTLPRASRQREGVPRLTFFCELDAPSLDALFADPRVTRDLLGLDANLSLGILDLSAERAKVVQGLNRAGIRVTAWQLLPEEQGYWFNADNSAQALARYRDFRGWTAAHGLRWEGVGLDIEPDIRELQQLGRDKRSILPRLGRRAFNGRRIRRATADYAALVLTIRADGYRVDSYQFPFIVDERRAGSALLQRVAGLVDVPADREVLMLYTSFLRPYGPGILWSYAPEAGSVGVGSTGGGVDLEGVMDTRPLDWDEFSRDLRLARCWSDDIHVFSLEGCARAGFLPRLIDFDWDGPVERPREGARRIESSRRALRAGLWASAHPWPILLGVVWLAWLLTRFRRR